MQEASRVLPPVRVVSANRFAGDFSLVKDLSSACASPEASVGANDPGRGEDCTYVGAISRIRNTLAQHLVHGVISCWWKHYKLCRTIVAQKTRFCAAPLFLACALFIGNHVKTAETS